MRPVMDSYDAAKFPPAAQRCARCGANYEARFAGPCAACLGDLRATIRGEAHTVDAEYVPKTNVTANAVATKDD
jgi:hypothetical protein